MESNVMTIRTKCDRSWPLFKLIDKYSEYQTDIRMYEDTDEVEVRFVLKKKDIPEQGKKGITVTTK